MSSKLTKTAAAIAFIIGAMSIVAGGQVILGKGMDYTIIGWLPKYNFILGLLSSFFTAIVIWRGSKMAMPTTIITLASNVVALLALKTTFRDEVAPESINAMIFRIAVWLVILGLMVVAARKGRHVLEAG
ncbi:MAG: hypothetical protein KBG20_13255 [Caldilineaceae bacterium]|nr:hypothetical protein [Caldilineaceae bacterium]MBP8108653.1 hypothetical protein [Caldilineaceae bacterium]MBP8123210.1 hypothetical protein [Caldilineaceae bacterium]MBP9073265.1 hypothetical protein [Caldilineaceae bacterium]